MVSWVRFWLLSCGFYLFCVGVSCGGYDYLWFSRMYIYTLCLFLLCLGFVCVFDGNGFFRSDVMRLVGCFYLFVFVVCIEDQICFLVRSVLVLGGFLFDSSRRLFSGLGELIGSPLVVVFWYMRV